MQAKIVEVALFLGQAFVSCINEKLVKDIKQKIVNIIFAFWEHAIVAEQRPEGEGRRGQRTFMRLWQLPGENNQIEAQLVMV